MSEDKSAELVAQEEPKPTAWRRGSAPLIFISHDTRDRKLAEAFAELLIGVSAGVLKPFCSSDKKGDRGIPFGREWYTEIMDRLEEASDVVCLLTKRSVGRPWILYEVGVAKGKSAGTPVHGVVLGIPLSAIVGGPFGQFQNLEGTEEELTKLMMQLVHRHPELNPKEETVQREVAAFLDKVDEGLEEAESTEGEDEEYAAVEQGSVARSFEEVKSMFDELRNLFGRAAEEGGIRPRRFRRVHPMMFEEMMHMGPRGDRESREVSWLLVISLFRDDLPWLYELGMEIYRAMKSKHPQVLKKAIESFRWAVEVTVHSPMSRELFGRDEGMMMMREELMMMSEDMLHRLLPDETTE